MTTIRLSAEEVRLQSFVYGFTNPEVAGQFRTRLVVPQAPRRPHLWSRCTWRRCRDRRHAQGAFRLARLDGPIDAGTQARLDRFIGYCQSYAKSHEVLYRNEAVQEEVRDVARAVLQAVAEMRTGRLSMPDRALSRPRPK
jgi:hypothetical protein